MVATRRQVRYCRAGLNGSFRRPTRTAAPDSRNKIAKMEISMNNPERINEDPRDSQHPNQLLTQQSAEELVEVEATKLGQVAGGGDGTVLGTGRV
jgi:hypothetical protein